MKKIILFLSIFFLGISNIYANSKIGETCTYKEKVDRCLEANLNGKNRTIEDFICISTQNELDVLYQIILDEKFREVDIKAQNYIDFLERNKDLYFGSVASKDLLDGISGIETEFSFYNGIGKQYLDLCNSSNPQSIINNIGECVLAMPIVGFSNFIESGICEKMARFKVDIFKKVSFNVLQINAFEIQENRQTQVTQDKRKKYDNLIELMMFNLNYLERIWKRWPSKTKDAY